MNIQDTCMHCPYYDGEFCLCNLPVYPCEQDDADAILDELKWFENSNSKRIFEEN